MRFQWHSAARRKEQEDDFSYTRELRDREQRLQALEEQLEHRARWVAHINNQKKRAIEAVVELSPPIGSLFPIHILRRHLSSLFSKAF